MYVYIYTFIYIYTNIYLFTYFSMYMCQQEKSVRVLFVGKLRLDTCTSLQFVCQSVNVRRNILLECNTYTATC